MREDLSSLNPLSKMSKLWALSAKAAMPGAAVLSALERNESLKKALENPLEKSLVRVYENPTVRKSLDIFNNPRINEAIKTCMHEDIVNAIKQFSTREYAIDPFSGFISKIARSSFCDFFVPSISLTNSPLRVTETHVQMMKECKWFPCIGWNEDFLLAVDILFAFRTEKRDTASGRARIIKNVDKIVFDYFKKSRLEAIRKSWRECGLPKHIIKVLNQCVRAYYKSEYILCICTIMTLWEGLICQKCGLSGWHRWPKVQKGLSTLISHHDLSAAIQSYCEDYIFYDCKGEDGYKIDVPGRHTYTHSWYTKYPSQKAALNAILFTDFLLHLSPISDS